MREHFGNGGSTLPTRLLLVGDAIGTTDELHSSAEDEDTHATLSTHCRSRIDR